MKLEQECGVTRISLANGEQLRRSYGSPVRVDLQWYQPSPEHAPEQRVVGYYQIPSVRYPFFRHTFTGFSWGYGGEGPHGLARWCRDNGIPLDIHKIAAMPGPADPPALPLPPLPHVQ